MPLAVHNCAQHDTSAKPSKRRQRGKGGKEERGKRKEGRGCGEVHTVEAMAGRRMYEAAEPSSDMVCSKRDVAAPPPGPGDEGDVMTEDEDGERELMVAAAAA